ncbi:hypothetical protein RO3G_10500 [Rhizopus delemar RA 99-880]|uniref:Uncharacterized protein n=1 Tax=Rhizopus delemar (strain RA 99-880 / ATCC MYA-4621 / FGSC 9543 / NRRL 43880) TaxID=246409 RepID=I1CBG0_RHIO9|nr:hypothetical protein RO3G_10500 [Rhizopus delemar RA 99-880]|eukprot:EIE85790.1 hypothetical protein RO3G_10500 [Rhizopus delemar RA 99-880]
MRPNESIKIDDITSTSPPKTPPGEKSKFSFKGEVRQFGQGEFESEQHFYPRVLNAQIHPLVQSFFTLGNERIIARYTHLNPQVKPELLKKVLSYTPKHFQWAGSDLFNVTTASGHRQMIVIETNSCPSGQKSMPLLSETGEHNEQGGYRVVIESAFQHQLSKADPQLGGLAVICDKNMMESTGYAAVLADVAKEHVWHVEWHADDPDPDAKWVDKVLYIRDKEKNWHPIRACFRYVTQKPWNRFPLKTRTIVMNQIISCLAGGRNKMMASRAYDFYNSEIVDTGLSIKTPETINNVTLGEIPLWIRSMGGHAVLKVPYSNAGQGVYTITNKNELNDFLSQDHHYDKFIVQSLVGNASWSSATRTGKFFHVGTIPNKKSNTFVSDLRMMVADDTWDMLGTNLSIKLPDGSWTTDTSRLILMDRKDFNQLGLGIDDLIDAYIQTVLAVIAIDRMAARLMADGNFDYQLFQSLNPDNALMDEIKEANEDF